MKITFLGCHAPYAPADGACNSYLVESEATKIVLDCGNGSFSNLQKYIDFRKVTAMVITHFHSDHFADIHCWRHAIKGSIRDGSRKNQLILYLPTEPQEYFLDIAAWKEEFVVIPIDEIIDQYNVIGDFNINFTKTNHPITTYAVSLRKDTKKIVYTSDTGWDSSLISTVDNANILICECSLRNADIEYTKLGHLTSKQAGTLALRGRVKELVLTHFWPEHNKFQLKREAEFVFPGNVVIAKEGMEINL